MTQSDSIRKKSEEQLFKNKMKSNYLKQSEEQLCKESKYNINESKIVKIKIHVCMHVTKLEIRANKYIAQCPTYA